MNANAETKFRLIPWVNTKSGATWFGIQFKPAGYGRYLHAFENGAALVYPSREEAKEKIAILSTLACVKVAA